VYKFNQAQEKQTLKFTRLPLYEVFQKFGSYLAFIIRFSTMLLAGFQKHSIDDSIIKKIYSAERVKGEDEEYDESYDAIADQSQLLAQIEEPDSEAREDKLLS